LAAAFLLNSARIAALILIGNAGAAGIALGGFHSQAGWISFNLVALGLVVSLRHVPWIARTAPAAVPADDCADNRSALYVLPFLAILAAGMVSRAFTAQFEWLYPLRLLAVAWALFRYRKQYRTFDWSFGWLAPIAGTAVFGLWIALDRLSPTPATSGISPGHGAAWVAWLVFRTLGATVTVPIAEELAFRGFLLRRFDSSDFQTVTSASWFAIVLSSVAFGLLHGERWLAGTIAGVIYAAALLRRRSIGDAIAAHATTNALIAGWVLIGGQWQLW
jgi:exosortase E/protease (VPEID-CTERM system)